MGPPTQVCVRSCPNISALAGRPFRNGDYGTGIQSDNTVSSPHGVHQPWDRNFKEYQGSDEIFDSEYVQVQLSRRAAALVAIREKYKQQKFKCVSEMSSPPEIPDSFFEDVKEL
ncbi:hypothetical protein Tco_0645360 [Tanacetum coccineum]